jgi:DNA-binding NtrC family response regulator
VKQGRFREDLYYRLNVFPISIPPLRSRREDIPDLARRFLARFAAEEGRPIRAITAEAMALIKQYDWPGNVRQLENAIFRAVVLCEGDELTIAEFPQIATHVDGFDVRIPPAPAIAPGQGLQVRTVREVVQVPMFDPNTMKLTDDAGDVRQLEDIEGEAIRFAIQHYRGQMSKVARKLSIGRSTLYRKLKDLGLDAGDEPEGEDEKSAA